MKPTKIVAAVGVAAGSGSAAAVGGSIAAATGTPEGSAAHQALVRVHTAVSTPGKHAGPWLDANRLFITNRLPLAVLVELVEHYPDPPAKRGSPPGERARMRRRLSMMATLMAGGNVPERNAAERALVLDRVKEPTREQVEYLRRRFRLCKIIG